MSRERDAIVAALAYIRWKSFGECRTDGYDIQPPTPGDVAAALEAALALPAPSAEPVAWLDEEHDCAYTRAKLDNGGEQGMRPLYAAPPDHTALLRQALEALEERYIGALRDSALDALRAALGEKRC